MEIENAIYAYNKALELTPEIENLHYKLGMLLYRTGNLKNALDPLRQFIIFQPDSLNVLANLGKILISNLPSGGTKSSTKV